VGGRREFVFVDPERAAKGPAFDHEYVAKALAEASKTAVRADRLPFDAFEFRPGRRVIAFAWGDRAWECGVAAPHGCVDTGPVPKPDEPARPRGGAPGLRSPGGTWTAFARGHDLVVRDRNGAEVRLTTDGAEAASYRPLAWAPKSPRLVATKVAPGEGGVVHLFETSPKEGGRARIHTRRYDLPGDRLDVHELWTFDVATGEGRKLDLEPIDFGSPRVRWLSDGRRFRVTRTDRGHGRFRVFEVDAETGAAKILLDERTETFINTFNVQNLWHLERSDDLIWRSEKDGWAHLYLVNGRTGDARPITRGEWVMRGVDHVDEERRQIWFRASGRNAGEDPYHVHHYRIDFDGRNLVALTEGDGHHTVQFSPDRRFLVDTYSRVDVPPVHVLRRASDGAKILELERADATRLAEIGWRAPEIFVAKGRDGKTDIWGKVVRPRDYDPSRAYPILEYIYAGPHDSFVPKSFSPSTHMTAMAELGFVVVQIDGMGTANRSKAFHDVAWRNLADAGFPDRIRWIQALAERYPYMDTSRVGIYGTSAGGQSSTGALLFHPEFYKVAVSAVGCHDNRMDKLSWNEAWMGVLGPHYEEQSNITNAHRLRGKLLLIVGEMDTNVPPESTLRLAGALIAANKDFDLLYMPGVGHSSGGEYGERRRRDFFVRHLHNVEPPDRNAE
jgi:dipeptidyl aminopeptidase/acylaminoacyl peptidase